MPNPPNPLHHLISQLGRLPSIGPRSAQRLALHLLQKPDATMRPLIEALTTTLAEVKTCQHCGNFDMRDPCLICTDPLRDTHSLCVIEDVAALWALERSHVFKGRYFVLGGVLSAINGIGPSQLHISQLKQRLNDTGITEVILALSATVDGQTTAHYLKDQLSSLPNLTITALAKGLPMGGNLDYLDEGTLFTAFAGRLRA